MRAATVDGRRPLNRRPLGGQYDHTAVVAEDITSRFLNVISLFNGSIPLVAFRWFSEGEPGDHPSQIERAPKGRWPRSLTHSESCEQSSEHQAH